MPDLKATVTTGRIIQRPDNLVYTEITDQGERAAIVAHMIRIGSRPQVGVEVGFSRQMKQGEVDDVVSASGEIDFEKATPVEEKIWCQIRVTDRDIEAAHALINEQKASYRNPAISQVLWRAMLARPEPGQRSIK